MAANTAGIKSVINIIMNAISNILPSFPNILSLPHLQIIY
jgi:hypothetical protein